MPRNTSPLTREEFDAICKIMDGRDFVVLHWGPEGLAYCNTTLGDGTGELVTRAARFLEREAPNKIGYDKGLPAAPEGDG